MTLADLWTCPKCKRRFAIRNQTHFCGHHTVEQHLKGKAPEAIELYHRFVELVRSCGPFTLTPTKTRIGFQVRMTFATVSLRKHHLACHVVLSRRLENPRFKLIQSLSPRNHVHHFRIRSVEELDDEVAAWLKEAYKVGEQKHRLRRSRIR
jgi:hypothetical protein